MKHNSVQLLSRVWHFVTPLTTAHQASLSITNSQSLLKLMSIESVMPSSHLILCHPLPLLPSIFPSIRVFSRVGSLHQMAKVLKLQPQDQFSLVAQSCPTLFDSIDYSTPGLPVHHQLPKFTQTHAHWVGDVIYPFHALLSPSPLAFSLSQNQGLQMSWFFTSGGQSIGVSTSKSILPMNIQGWFPLGWTG